jgi:hypothetical protein
VEIPVDVNVNIIPGSFKHARVDLDNQKQSIDIPFVFKVTAFDDNENIADL